MENNYAQNMDPNFIPEEYRVPFDIIELPSQGILYPNKKPTVKVEYLTTMDENILTSPNLSSGGRMIDVLLERKVKDLGFNVEDLIEGDRIAILIYLRSTGFGHMYSQPVINPKTKKVEMGEIDLSTLKQKKLGITPDQSGEFDYELPTTKKTVKFRLLTGKDESEISEKNEMTMKRNGDDISYETTLRLEREIMEVDGIRDKMKISALIKNMSIIDSRSLRKYISEIEPGIDFKTTATIQGGVETATFLRFGSNFLWPEL
jgi:hypothetical protein